MTGTERLMGPIIMRDASTQEERKIAGMYQMVLDQRAQNAGFAGRITIVPLFRSHVNPNMKGAANGAFDN